MASIVDPIKDLLTLLTTIPVKNGDGNIVPLYTRVWNTQLQYEIAGQTYNGPKPAAFIEVPNGLAYNQLGGGVQSVDLTFRVHIIHEQFDAQDGTMEQDLNVFTLRNTVMRLLCASRLTNCGPTTHKSDTQDFTHTNLYHFVSDYVCHFIDTTASPYDPTYPNGMLHYQFPAPYLPDIKLTVGTQKGGGVPLFIIKQPL